MEATISRWTSDTIEFLDKEALHVKGGIAGVKAVLVGVGVGGWVRYQIVHHTQIYSIFKY